MICLINRGFRIKSTLNILDNQVKCPEIYNECFCLGCNVNDKYNVNDNDNDNDNDKDNVNDNDLRFSFAKNDNVIDNDNHNDKDNVIDNDNVNEGTCFAYDVRSSFANNDNDLRSSFANQGTEGVRGMPTCSADNDNDNVKDKVIYQFDEKHQKGKPNNRECPTNAFSININEDLRSWLNYNNIITEATLPENFRCIISGPSECGKTFLLKKLILSSIYFDKLYIIGPTGDQYIGLERINPKADIEFFKDIKVLPSHDKLCTHMMYEVALLIMITIYEVALLIKERKESVACQPAPQIMIMIMLKIKLYINLMKNIKRVNPTIENVLLTLSL